MSQRRNTISYQDQGDEQVGPKRLLQVTESFSRWIDLSRREAKVLTRTEVYKCGRGQRVLNSFKYPGSRRYRVQTVIYRTADCSGYNVVISKYKSNFTHI